MSSDDFPKDYVNNAKLIEQIKIGHALQEEYGAEAEGDGVMKCITAELSAMIDLLVTRYASSYSWRGYSWIEDMKTDAVLNLNRVALKFNFDKAGDYPNPFGYYTQIIKRSFIAYRDREMKQARIKDAIIEMHSNDTTLLPSYARQYEEATNSLGQDLDGTKRIPTDPKKRRRRKKQKVCREDDWSKMSKAEYDAWMARKIEEFKQRKAAEASENG